jgi:hypothetical protein
MKGSMTLYRTDASSFGVTIHLTDPPAADGGVPSGCQTPEINIES